MCLKWFKRKSTLPYPEEQPDYSKTPTLDEVFKQWYDKYNVPTKYRDYWRYAIVITVDGSLSYPAGTWDGADGKRHLAVRPEYLNKGVIAHEQAHNSYALLTDNDRKCFADVYKDMRFVSIAVRDVFKQHPYASSSDVEAHAEIYRYLGSYMPVELKPYYPRLF